MSKAVEVIWKCRGLEFDLSEKGIIMGILNATPDSFSDGGSYNTIEKGLEHALQMSAEGADIIDIGGESTRPGAESVSLEEELKRTIPLIEAIRSHSDIAISIDTSKSVVARKALLAGANIVNDVTGLEGDAQMEHVCRSFGCGVVVMHMQGRPASMQEFPQYENVNQEVVGYFHSRYHTLISGGMDPEAICFDPGIGFGKLDTHNLSLLQNLRSLEVAGRPLLLGVSRKSFIGRLLNEESLILRDWPTVALTSLARMQGVMIYRVHEVKENIQSQRMAEAILRGSKPV